MMVIVKYSVGFGKDERKKERSKIFCAKKKINNKNNFFGYLIFTSGKTIIMAECAIIFNDNSDVFKRGETIIGK